MMNLRRPFLVLVAVVCQFSSPIALASSAFRMDAEHFTVRVDDVYRFLNARETARIMIEDWGNPSSQVMEQNPLGMIVDKNFPQGSNWGIVITATHDGHVSDKDAKRIDESGLLQIIRREYFRMNKQRKAAGAEPVTSLDWVQEPQYDSHSNQMIWAKDIGFGKSGTRTLNYAVRILGRENTIHLNAVGSMDELGPITKSMQSIVASSSFDEGYRYRDFNPRYHRSAEYGLTALVTGQAKVGRLQNLWNSVSGSFNVMIACLSGVIVALGRWMTRRRLPEF